MTLDELKAKLDSFSPVKVEFVSRMVNSLANPPRVDIGVAGTWITNADDWIEYFGLALSVHHGATTEPLKDRAFETVFRNACAYMHWSVDSPGSPTQRFVDMTVNPGNSLRRLSLKSTAAQNLSEFSVHITKLTEAAWIQDARTLRERKNKTLSLFKDYQEAVTEIVMLRAFRENRDEAPKRYQLVEIPVSIFDSVQKADLSVFESDAPKVDCYINEERVARVALDRSDAKITVGSIKLSACTVHAEWSHA